VSVASDILSEIQATDNSSTATIDDITDAMKSDGWENAAEYVKTDNPTILITSKDPTTTWTSQDEETYALDHFTDGIRAIIKAGKAVIPYKSTLTDYTKYVIITRNKVYNFPTNNVNYWNAVQGAVKYYGASSYFASISESTNATTCTNSGNSFINSYNYQAN
tara:strand:+ start:221 stop:709 length:489 start_codon:yes stop_codon:yes gene_type:complete